MEKKPPTNMPASPTPPNADQRLFVGTVISLTWQLFIVVLVPFLGGHFLDVRFDTAPLFTLLGLVLALLLTGAVTYRAYQVLAAGPTEKKND